MKGEKLSKANDYVKKHKRASLWYRVVVAMAVIVVFVTTYMLILPAITMESTAVCGKQEHTHTDECYETVQVLTCGLSEGQQESIDGVEDTETSGSSAEVVYHTHTDECYEEQKVLVCSIEEHTHTAECYETVDETETDEEYTGVDLDSVSYGNLGDYITSVEAVEQAEVFEFVVAESVALKTAAAVTGKELPANKVTASGTTYDADNDYFETELHIEFTIDGSTLNGEYVFVYELPDVIGIYADLGTVYSNTVGTYAFDYYFQKDDSGQYYIVVTFDENFATELGTSTADGYIDFAATIDSSAAQDDDSIYVKFGSELPLIIPASEITYPANSTSQADITSTKSASYDSTANTVTYSITVYSEKGSGSEISLEDAITDFANSGLTITDYDITVYNATAVTYSQYYTGVEKGSELGDSDYTVYVDETTGSISMTLPKLSASGSEDNSGNAIMNAYVIEYTYTLDELAAGTSVNLSNGVTVTSTPNSDTTITSTSTASTKISTDTTSMVSKSASVSGSSITWTITVGDGSTPLENYVLTDTMLSSAIDSSIIVSPSDGGYTIDESSGTVTFNSSAAAKYTITYTTEADSWSWISNTATLEDDTGETVGTASASARNQSGGLTKTNGTVTAQNGTVNTVEWTVKVSIPESGLADYTLSDTLWQTDQGHYMSYDDVKTLYTSLVGALDAAGIGHGTLQLTSSDGTTYDYDDNISQSLTYKGYSIYIEAVDYADVKSFEYTYTTSVDTSYVTKSTTYQNYVSYGGTSTSGSYTYAKKVIKMDGNGSTSDSATTNVEGYVTWIVQVNLDSDVIDAGLVITDSLPSEIELTKLEVSPYYNYGYSEISTDGTITVWDSMNFTTTVNDSNEVVTTITSNNGTPSYVCEGGTIYLQYTCKISDSYMPEEDTTKNFTLENEVDVELNGDDYGTASQTQTVTAGEKSDTLTKTYTWDKDSQTVTFSVIINPYAQDLISDSDTITIKDTLTYMDNSAYEGTYRNYELDIGSVTLYYSDKYGNKLSELTSSEWSLDSYEESTNGYTDVYRTVTMTVPDSTALVLEYTYDLTDFVMGENTYTYETYLFSNNKITIDGLENSDSSSVSGDQAWEKSTTSAGINIGYTIYKYSANKLNEALEGAVFDLYGYNSTDDSYVKVDTYTTGEDGYIKIVFSGSSVLTYNTLYYLVETCPPNGYKLPDSTELLYFYASNSNTETYPESMPDDVPDDAVNVAENKNYIANISNAAVSTTDVEVSKEWYYSSGNINYSPSTSEIKFDLLKYYKPWSHDADTDTVTVSYSLSGTWGTTTKTGSVTVPVGTEMSFVLNNPYANFNYWVSVPALVLYNNGESVANIAYNNVSSLVDGLVWSNVNGATFTYTFTANENTALTGTIDAGYIDSTTYSLIGGTSSYDVTSVSNLDSSYTLLSSETYTLSYSGDSTKSWKTTITGLPLSGTVNGVYCDFIYAIREITDLDGYVTSYEVSDGAVVIKNTASDSIITVVKKWLDSEGKEISNTSDSITFGLYQKATDSNGAVVDDKLIETYTISNACGWQEKIDMSSYTTSGYIDNTYVTYTYYVKEDEMSGYTVTYDNNDIGTNGTITINNQEIQSMVLPETGGKGTTVYTMGGAIALLFAACLLIYKSAKRRQSYS